MTTQTPSSPSKRSPAGAPQPRKPQSVAKIITLTYDGDSDTQPTPQGRHDIQETGATSESAAPGHTSGSLSALVSLIGETTRGLDRQLSAITQSLTPLHDAFQTADAGALRLASQRIAQQADHARAACATLTMLTQALSEPLCAAPVELADLLMAIIPRWKTRAPAHSFELSLLGPEPTVVADGTRIEQALMAIIECAVALAPEGGDVRIALRGVHPGTGQAARRDEHSDLRPLAPLDDLGEAALISVRSVRSQPLPAEALDHLCEPFYNPSRETNIQVGGGLGLALAQVIATQHGGRLWAENGQPGQATTLHLALPLTLSPAQTGVSSVSRASYNTRDQAPIAQLALTRTQPVILAIQGEPRLARYLRANLDNQRYRTLIASTFEEALRQVDLEEPDLLLLDGGLPGMEHLEVLQRLLSQTGAPIIVLARKSDAAQCTRTLDLGAADYLSLPFSIDELLARVRAALRVASRANSLQDSGLREPVFTSGALTIDYAQRLVAVEGKPVSLSKTEYKLLRALAQHAGMTLTHEALLERVWGPAYRQEVEFVWVYVRRLRRKIEPDPARPQFILTAPGVGYRLARL